MAAVPELRTPDLAALQTISVDDLNPLLDEESRSWRQLLSWDFTHSAELVRRFIRMQALSGYCLRVGHRTVGYAYYVCEERKGLIGDLYVSDEFASSDNESRLLAAVLHALAESGTVRRVESQLMMLRSPMTTGLPMPSHARVYPRLFLTADLHRPVPLATHESARSILFEPWSERRQDEAAQLIADAYHRHVDSQINDQYRSVSGARRFLQNIVQYPGCGTFLPQASLLAVQPYSGKLCGLVLGSSVARDVGHITQICVSPAVKGTGIGFELLRRAMRHMAQQGYSRASLTVTAANVEAIRLYERVGFQQIRRFGAFVWEGL